MLLSTLLQGIYDLPPQTDCQISRLILDSRQVKPHDLFLAIKGTQQDGRQHIASAIAAGAAAVLMDADASNQRLNYQSQIPIVPVYRLQQAVGPLAARFFDCPANQLRMIGVTGTSGKTSCTHFIAQALQSQQITCGLIGTLGSGFLGALDETGLTTPDAVRLHAELKKFVAQHTKVVAMEVSSHSIDQGRVNTVPFEMGIFTNLSQDHLDYHHDMAAYAAVKKRFFTELPTHHAIINAEDSYGIKWIHELAASKPVFAYSSQPVTGLPGGTHLTYAKNIQLSLGGIHAEVISPWGTGEVRLQLMGRFNLSNVLAVLTALCLYGLPFEQALASLTHLRSVPGRMQILSEKGSPLIVIDYAHKPDALEKVLQTLRQHTQGKLICVFGCGGNRDATKRPKMAAIAEQYSDQVIVTNDNPRHENPHDIAQQILRGFIHPQKVTVLLDRSKAIQNSIEWASPADCVLIAGKGAEHYQQIGDEKLPFDDMKAAAACLKRLAP